MTQEPDIKRWTAKRKAELIKQIYRGQTTVPEAARHYDLTQQEIEKWMDDAEAGMENALKANPKDIAEQYESQLRELKEAYGEAMLGENKNTIQRLFQLKGWQVRKRRSGARPRVQALPSVASCPNERWAGLGIRSPCAVTTA